MKKIKHTFGQKGRTKKLKHIDEKQSEIHGKYKTSGVEQKRKYNQIKIKCGKLKQKEGSKRENGNVRCKERK